MNYLKMIEDEEELLIKYRRHFHQFPELSGVEFETLETIKSELGKLDIEYVHVQDGGVLGFIGDKSKGKSILLRGDIDALPIMESKNNLNQEKASVSQIAGVSHMCGHDAHTAMLLMQGKLLKEMENDLDGEVILCFEQGEEGTGNYVNILKYMDDNQIVPDSVYGAHVAASIDSGMISIEPGPIMAGAFVFEFKLTGRGGHGSRPDIANSPIDCFTAINSGLDVLRMKRVSPFEPLTLSIGKIIAGSKANVIPETLEFAGTIRYFNSKVGNDFIEEMVAYVKKMAELHDLECEFNGNYVASLSAVNTPELALNAQNVIKEHLGEERLYHAEPAMGSETFAAFLDKYSGVYAHLGIKNEEVGSGGDHHNPVFDVDDGALKYGVAAAIAYAVDYLNN